MPLLSPPLQSLYLYTATAVSAPPYSSNREPAAMPTRSRYRSFMNALGRVHSPAPPPRPPPPPRVSPHRPPHSLPLVCSPSLGCRRRRRYNTPPVTYDPGHHLETDDDARAPARKSLALACGYLVIYLRDIIILYVCTYNGERPRLFARTAVTPVQNHFSRLCFFLFFFFTYLYLL